MIPKWRKLTAMILVTFSLISCNLSGNPFEQRSDLKLDRLRLDGDLYFVLPLCKMGLGEEWVDVYLDHEMRPLDYGDAQSTLLLRPFITYVYSLRDEGNIWVRPGGGDILFRPEDCCQKRDEQSADSTFSEDGWENCQIYRREGVTMYMDRGRHRSAICDGGWVLLYRNESLYALVTPRKRRIDVGFCGRMITSLTEERTVIASIRSDSMQRSMEVKVGDRIYKFRLNEVGQITQLKGEARPTTVLFGFDRGLLASVQSGEEYLFDCEWQENLDARCGDSFYQKPWHIKRVGEVSYGYSVSDGMVRLSVQGGSGKVRKLRVGMNYGRILWLRAD